MTFDEVRAAYGHVGLALYALEPGGPVTLEILTPGGHVYSFVAKTAEQAIAKAFPPEPKPAPPEQKPPNIQEPQRQKADEVDIFS